jgi:hypothetical protein
MALLIQSHLTSWIRRAIAVAGHRGALSSGLLLWGLSRDPGAKLFFSSLTGGSALGCCSNAQKERSPNREAEAHIFNSSQLIQGHLN